MKVTIFAAAILISVLVNRVSKKTQDRKIENGTYRKFQKISIFQNIYGYSLHLKASRMDLVPLLKLSLFTLFF